MFRNQPGDDNIGVGSDRGSPPNFAITLIMRPPSRSAPRQTRWGPLQPLHGPSGKGWDRVEASRVLSARTRQAPSKCFAFARRPSRDLPHRQRQVRLSSTCSTVALFRSLMARPAASSRGA